ncbi:MAG: tetratricopeptide repeat protein [Candidatus Schekmanbacteria bacterium]|nr:tetratricopeptide repeat protein [Candidatus Schekmanbacteria bacterium]
MSAAPVVIGPYRLLVPLGQGSMGVVWLAEHTTSRHRVALKTVRVPSELLLRGIRTEIRSLTRLRHPGIVRVDADGVHQGMPWYAMELLNGVTVRSWARSVDGAAVAVGGAAERQEATHHAASSGTAETGAQVEPTESLAAAGPHLWWTRSLGATLGGAQATPPSSADPAGSAPVPPAAVSHRLQSVLTLVHRLCSPLAYLHGLGIVHRDLKPDNILVRADGRPVIVDFGLAAIFGGDESREPLSVDSGSVGTVSYMAPEQIRGELLDARADLYGLGCIIYELLTGLPPFRGERRADILYGHLYDEPLPPSRRVGGIPPALDHLVLRLLEKRRKDRLGYADIVASALADLGAVADADVESPAPRPYLYRPGLAGRANEMTRLRDHLGQLVRDRGGIVLVGGESGIGKTRLVSELVCEALDRQITVVGGECRSAGGGALHAFYQAFEAIADRCREHGPDETDRLLGHRGRLLARFDSSLAGLPGQEAYPEPAELTGDAGRLRVLAYVAETLAALASAEPLLLVLDDLQWADSLSLEVLGYLLNANRIAPLSLLILGTYRSEEAGERLRQLLRTPGVHCIALGGLAETAIATIAGDMLALDSPPEAFVRHLARHSEGNPYFAAEYLRLAVDGGRFTRSARGRWESTAAWPAVDEAAGEAALPLPASLRRLVGRRLDGLSEAARRLAEAGAVLGRSTELALVAKVLGVDEEGLVEAAEEVFRRQVMEVVGIQGELHFVHDKIREVAYERIPADARADLHRGAAEALEREHGSERDAPLADLGRHWREAGEREKARRCFLAAARRAKSACALADAQPLYESYLAIVETPTPESVEARRELGAEVLRLLGHAEEAQNVLRGALQDSQTIGNRRSEALALGSLSLVYRDQGRMETALALGDQALTIHREVGNRWGVAVILTNLAGLHHKQGRMVAAQEHYEQACAIFRQEGNRWGEGVALGGLALLHCDCGQLDTARALYEQTLSIDREVGNRQDEGVTLCNLANLLFEQGRLDTAHELLSQALAIHREVGNRRSEGITLGNLAELDRAQGRAEAAQHRYEQALAINRMAGNRSAAAEVLRNLASLHLAQGRMETARDFYEQAMVIHREVGDRRSYGITLGEFADWHRLAAGDLESARRHATLSRELLLEVSDQLSLARLLCHQARIEIAAGRSGRDHLEEATELAVRIGLPPESESGQLLAHLRHAQDAFEADACHRLFRGDLVEHLTPGQRQWLVEHGHLGAAAGMGLPARGEEQAPPAT